MNIQSLKQSKPFVKFNLNNMYVYSSHCFMFFNILCYIFYLKCHFFLKCLSFSIYYKINIKFEIKKIILKIYFNFL